MPVNECPGGIGIQAGVASARPAQTGHLDLDNVTVSGYQKNGITIDGAGSTAVIDGAIVAGAGPTNQLAQNGIQVSHGADASITASRVTGNECDAAGCGADAVADYQSAGILLYASGAGTTITDSELAGNDMGVYYLADPGPPAAGRGATLRDDTFTGNRYEAVVLDQGSALIAGCGMTEGNVGVEALQYAGQSLGLDAEVLGARISDMTEATVQVLASGPARTPGSLLVTGSDISSAPVLDDSAGIRIIRHADH
jgi:hypothetical protein